MFCNKIFVFGTLKENFPNSSSNKGRRLHGKFITKLAFPLYLVGDRHSPWLIDLENSGFHVAGQVFTVDNRALKEMDVLERTHEPDGYTRKIIEIISHQGSYNSTIHAYAYLKSVKQLDERTIKIGPLSEYTLEHAALYTSRSN